MNNGEFRPISEQYTPITEGSTEELLNNPDKEAVAEVIRRAIIADMGGIEDEEAVRFLHSFEDTMNKIVSLASDVEYLLSRKEHVSHEAATNDTDHHHYLRLAKLYLDIEKSLATLTQPEPPK